MYSTGDLCWEVMPLPHVALWGSIFESKLFRARVLGFRCFSLLVLDGFEFFFGFCLDRLMLYRVMNKIPK